ncbi:hypothetical protein [Apibacter sp. HY039]|uniref:hypothetical protein n=1 Tax=Apibacter sp. HY039 TaxID=2501476 RepID=UPI000FEB879C|nr:hypothetical protein [Apibacter sp. HY039]
MLKKFNFICYAILLPFILSFITYFGFTSKYAQVHANLNKLPDLYYSGLYNYRFLSRDLLTHIYNWLSPFLQNLRNQSIFKPMNTLGTDFFILTVLYNTLFYILSCIILYKILIKNIAQPYLLYFLIIFIFALSQYVITPFDNASMFFFFLSIYFIFKLNEKFNYSYTILLSLLVIISTCNRESSALTLSFYASVLVNSKITNLFKKQKIQYLLKCLWLPVLSFLIAYIGIRIFIHTDKASLVEGNYFSHNYKEIKNILGFIFYLIITYFSITSSINKNYKYNVYNYIVFSFPYIITIIYAGLLWEIRLYIPLIAGQLILANYKLLSK